MNCDHCAFMVKSEVARLEDVGRFSVDIRIFCAKCDLPFLFRGLPVGLNLNGAAMSFGGEEARLAIYPSDEEPPNDEGATGFSIRPHH